MIQIRVRALENWVYWAMSNQTFDRIASTPGPVSPDPVLAPLGEEDVALLLRPELRSARFSLEYARTELALRSHGIRSTIIVFGSAQCPSPEDFEALPASMRTERMASRVARYQTAREFARIASLRGGAVASNGQRHDNVVATGGGPGIMEAANRGASEAGAPTIGFNITLPIEQVPNRYITPELSFRFHYFAMRKMHLAVRAKALIVFPGGFGTLDELFEILTLQQTGKMPPAPVVLFDEGYWRRLIDFDLLIEERMIASTDAALLSFANTAEETWDVLMRKGLSAPGEVDL